MCSSTKSHSKSVLALFGVSTAVAQWSDYLVQDGTLVIFIYFLINLIVKNITYTVSSSPPFWPPPVHSSSDIKNSFGEERICGP